MAPVPGTGEIYSVSSFTASVRKGRFKLVASVFELGPDILAAVWGGTRPHIGAVGMAQARPSLMDEERASATSSVFAFLGHKEDAVAKALSEELTRRLSRNSVVVAGLHWDDLNDEEIRIVLRLCRQLTEKIIRKIGKAQE